MFFLDVPASWMIAKNGTDVAGHVETVDHEGDIVPEIVAAGGDPRGAIAVNDKMVLGWIVRVCLHQKGLESFPKRVCSLMDIVPFSHQFGTVVFDFPPLMNSGYFFFFAFALISLPFGVETIHFDKQNVLL